MRGWLVQMWRLLGGLLVNPKIGRATFSRKWLRRDTFRRRTVLTFDTLEDRVVLDAEIARSFQGLAFPDDGRYVPPDSHLAAGPNHLVEVVNSTIAYFDKAGTKLYQQTQLLCLRQSGGLCIRSQSGL